MIDNTKYGRGATRPSLSLWIFDDDGALIDFSSGYTFTARIGDRGHPAVAEIPDNRFAGALGTGDDETAGSVPNLRISWQTGDLDIAPGEYTLQIAADSGASNPRYFFRNIEIEDIILAPL